MGIKGPEAGQRQAGGRHEWRSIGGRRSCLKMTNNFPQRAGGKVY